MVVVEGTAPIQPDKWDAAVAACLTVQAATRPEPGCIRYTFYSELEPTHTIHVFEVWESDEALDAHLNTLHVLAFFATLGEVVSSPPVVNLYYISNVRPL
ncbi:MAG: putative quinol monooxygenase [Chthonomonadales bacterium]